MSENYIPAEHMLFYASEKYPSEGSYMKFIAEVFLAAFWSCYFLLAFIFQKKKKKISKLVTSFFLNN